jgi:hypothetical protein
MLPAVLPQDRAAPCVAAPATTDNSH